MRCPLINTNAHFSRKCCFFLFVSSAVYCVRQQQLHELRCGRALVMLMRRNERRLATAVTPVLFTDTHLQHRMHTVVNSRIKVRSKALARGSALARDDAAGAVACTSAFKWTAGARRFRATI